LALAVKLPLMGGKNRKAGFGVFGMIIKQARLRHDQFVN
jgi:hypothetical protein